MVFVDTGAWFALSVPSDVRDQAVLPGSVLCLVENAMKHGRPINGIALQLQVSALHVGDRLQIEVRDNGPGLGTRSDTESTGTGLRNLQDRLRLSYDTLANLALRQDANAEELKQSVARFKIE